MIDFSECARKGFCVYCDDPDCIHAGDIEADYPKWKCDNPTMDCENCEFLMEYKGGDNMRYCKIKGKFCVFATQSGYCMFTVCKGVTE